MNAWRDECTEMKGQQFKGNPRMQRVLSCQ